MTTATLHVYNIKEGSSGDKPGFFHLRRVVNRSKAAERALTRVIVCGGDGTIMWAVTEMEMHCIDTDLISVGVVPFGGDFFWGRIWGLFRGCGVERYDYFGEFWQ